jgi:hypothetical protein
MNLGRTTQPGNDDYDLRDYMIGSSYTLAEISRRTIKALPRPEHAGIPDDLQEKFAAMLNRLGAHQAPPNSPPTPKTRPYSPSCLLREDGVTINHERVQKLIQIVRAQATAKWMPDDDAARDAANRDDGTGAFINGQPIPKPPSGLRYCTCSGAAGGGPCTCRFGQA